jgi:hypothetical protein
MANEELRNAFAEALTVADSYFEEAQADVARVKAGSPAGSPERAAGTKRMLDALTLDGADGPRRLFIGAVSDGKPTAAGIDLLYRTHAAISDAALLSLAAAEKRGDPAFTQSLLQTYDRVLLCSRTLMAVFNHLQRFVGEPGAAQLILVHANRRPRIDAIYDELEARRSLDALMAQHEADLAVVKREVEALASDVETLRAFQAVLPSFRMPVWAIYKDGALSKVINNVWFPPELVAQGLSKLAEQRARTTGGVGFGL